MLSVSLTVLKVRAGGHSAVCLIYCVKGTGQVNTVLSVSLTVLKIRAGGHSAVCLIYCVKGTGRWT